MVDSAYLVAAGGILGALSRHGVDEAIDSETIPFGTLTVNVLGSFLLGLVLSLPASDDVALLAGVGFCGAFTTFSSFSVDVVQLWEKDRYRVAVAYAAANILGALAAIAVACAVTRIVSGM